MRRLAVSVLLLALAPLSRAADNDGFTPLFNGKDLSGWVGVQIAPSTFTVKNGLIFCTGVPTGVLRTEKMYENFIVECEWRHLVPKGNAGFFVWSDALTSKGQPFTRSVEVQVLDGHEHPERRHTSHGDVFPIHGATMIPDNPHKSARPGQSGRSYPTEDRSNPSPQWNHYRIECRDGSISLAVNGKVVTTGKNASPRKGYICLESEGGQVEWRNLRIKELPPSPNLDAKDVATPDEGFKSLYNGIDLDGWIPPKGGGGWQANDWKLHYEPTRQGQSTGLLRMDKWSDFELIVDVSSAAPAEVIVLGRTVKIDPINPGKAAWRRAHITSKSDRVTATVDDKQVPVTEPPDGKNPFDWSIGLKPTAPADFANVYLKQ
jgi:hypothetical protein